MDVALKKDSAMGRGYFSWYKRTGEPQPRTITTCHVRKILIYEFLHWSRKHRILGTRIPPWVIYIVAFLVIGAIIAPEFVQFLLMLPLVILASFAVTFVIAAVLLLIFRIFSVEYWIDRLVQKLADPVMSALDWLEKKHEQIWNIRVGGFPVGWLLITIFLIAVQVLLSGFYAATHSFILFLVLLIINILEGFSILMVGLGVILGLNERYEPLRRIQERRERRVMDKEDEDFELSSKPKGLYRILIEVGICKYVEWVDPAPRAS